MRLLIYGAGGHAQVVADAARAAISAGMLDCEVVGFVDDAPARQGTHVLGLPVLGPTTAAAQVAHDAVVVAIGANAVRRRLAQQCLAQGRTLATIIHPRAVLAPDVEVGVGTVIFAGAIVNTGSRIGSNAILNTGCTVDHHNVIGDDAHIAPGVHLGGEVEVGDGAFVGIGATVMPRASVGAWSVVGAGSLVHRPVPPHVTVVGVPARLLRTNKDA